MPELFDKCEGEIADRLSSGNAVAVADKIGLVDRAGLGQCLRVVALISLIPLCFLE